MHEPAGVRKPCTLNFSLTVVIMADLVVNGGRPLSGTITPSGNKNSVLPIVCASLLTDDWVELTNVPDITDLEKLLRYFSELGSQVEWDRSAGRLRLCHAKIADRLAGGELPQGMRSAVLLFAPLVHRFGRLTVAANTKGCALGVRELDPHLEILAAFGVNLHLHGEVRLERPARLNGHRHWADYMSVTATENFLMAAAVAKGESVLINAASEPHVQDLCVFLQAMGAQIEGVGTSMLRVHGVETLHGATAAIASDHHEICTFLALGAITGGDVTVTHHVPHHFDLIARAFGKLGVSLVQTAETAQVIPNQQLEVVRPFTPNLLPKIEAAPWPYFPVDLLPLMVALSIQAKGDIHFWNKVYEGGFTWIPELVKFGAHVVISDPHRIIVFGNRPLRPAVVESPYIIRAAVALFMAAASIPGRSVVKNADSIRRAHPRFVENLQRLGADVAWED